MALQSVSGEVYGTSIQMFYWIIKCFIFTMQDENAEERIKELKVICRNLISRCNQFKKLCVRNTERDRGRDREIEREN